MSKNQQGLTCKNTIQKDLTNCGEIRFRKFFSLYDVLIVRSAYSMCYMVIKQRQWCCGELRVYK